MTTTALVPVFTGTLAGQPTQLCNARDLHATLGVDTRFDDWIRRRIEEYGFTEGEDFSSKLRKTRGRPATDYHLTLDMAKELAMVENNERGRQVRRYFIAIEKATRAKASHSGPAPKALPAIDLAAMIRSTNSTPTVPLPSEVQGALNRRAWALAHDAYELVREQLARRIAYTCEIGGGPRLIWKERALQIIAETTLDTALAPRQYEALHGVMKTMEMVAEAANAGLARMRAELGRTGGEPTEES